MIERIEAETQNYPWLVYEIDGKIVGYTYGRRWRERGAYRNSVETGTYLDSRFVGRGTGT